MTNTDSDKSKEWAAEAYALLKRQEEQKQELQKQEEQKQELQKQEEQKQELQKQDLINIASKENISRTLNKTIWKRTRRIWR